ncbi:hypothetical protein ERJ75_001392200 [Trypanosoma vivax]|nr:hypothetical protein ERJ75_001392200 [Trypanosoma vivax]
MISSENTAQEQEMMITRTGRGTFRPITEAELNVALRELSSDTAPDDDEIRFMELTHLAEWQERNWIFRMFNYSLRTGQATAKWRHGIIVPLLKSSRTARSMASFGPVMHTRRLRIIMERIVARRVRDCIEDKLQPHRARIGQETTTTDTLMQVTGALR